MTNELSYCEFYHDEVMASITRVTPWTSNQGIHHSEYYVIELSSNGVLWFKESASSYCEAKQWIDNEFKFPSSILILKYRK